MFFLPAFRRLLFLRNDDDDKQFQTSISASVTNYTVLDIKNETHIPSSIYFVLAAICRPAITR